MNESHYSANFLRKSREINIFSTILVVLIGLIGHTLIIYVFGQKKYNIFMNFFFNLVFFQLNEQKKGFELNQPVFTFFVCQ